MNKRALMLTAATIALFSGHSKAASPCNASTSTAGNCDITTQVTAPIYTGTAAPGVTNAQGGLGNITIDTNGSVIIATNPPVAPAVTINSNNTVTNSSQITYQGISSAVGVLLEESSVPTAATGAGSVGNPENFTGEFFSSSGTINLTGAGSGKNGILIAGGAFPGTSGTTSASTGVYANTGLGVFTGVTGFEPAGGASPVAIDIAAGSVIEVQGTNSFGINLINPTFTATMVGGNTVNVPSGGGSLIGDIDVGGTISMTPTTVGDTAPALQNIGIFIGGFLPSAGTPTNPAFAGTPFANCACAMVGNINIQQGGSVSSEGQGAEGVVVQGGIQGSIINSGTLQTEGTSAPSTALNAADPEGSWALAVSNNVTGGIFNGGPTAQGAGAAAARATISMTGNTAAVEISPLANNIATASPVPQPVTIGGFTDSTGFTYSLLNRGSISARSEDANIGNTAISIFGQSGANVALTNGIFNSGTISSSVVTNADGPTTASSLTSTGIVIGNFTTIGNGVGGPSTVATPYALVNSNETGAGSISASVSGAQTGTAIAVLIQGASTGNTPGNLPSIFNSGSISATASTTNLLVSSIQAIAIEDASGKLTNIFNTGSITAATSELENNAQSAIAIDVSNNTTSGVTVTNNATASNSASIVGDIQFGSQPSNLIVNGISNTDTAAVSGNIFFRNQSAATNDQIMIGNNASVSGEIFELNHAAVDITVANTGVLNYLTTLPTNINSNVSVAASANTPLKVGMLKVVTGGNLNISLSQGNNVNAFTANNVTVINASSANIGGDGISPTLSLGFGGFVGSPVNGQGSQFVLISVPQGGSFQITPQELTLLVDTFDSALNPNPNAKTSIPFLFSSTICGFNIGGATGNEVCSGAEPYNATNQELVLTLTPKNPALPVNQGGLGLRGFALKMFPFVNQALVNDNTLGAAMVTDITNQQEAQAAYASFAPDVSGATRATAISLTDSATNIVAARQRELRMYANQEGDTTLWGQEFAERLSQGNTDDLTGYNDSGFGFAIGMDQGDQVNGRYGVAFTFFSGGMSAKEPTEAKTSSQYYILSGYSDWRGKGLFIDTQLSAGYGNLKGKRFINLTNGQPGTALSREADGNRPTELLAGSVTTGGIFTAGATVFMPQFDIDGLTMREEGYTESNGGEGVDLHVQPYYANSLRAFLGANVREDVNFGEFYFQPELRVGYRYDLVDGAAKLKANFASVDLQNGQEFNEFSITGPDPGRGNLVLGGGVATTTGAWSIGISYDYLRASGGPTVQTGEISLVARI